MKRPARNEGGDRPALALDLAIEAGAWSGETALDRLVRNAVDAAFDELDVRTERQPADVELSLVFTDDASIKALNAEWRGKDKATNVLSFPAFPANKSGPVAPMLGDIVIAYETVLAEAKAESKPFDDHLTHLVVHGLLHLIGYDHETDEEGDEMEALETRILARLAIDDPYR